MAGSETPKSAMTPQDFARSLYRLADVETPPVDLVPMIRELGLRIVELDLIGTMSALQKGRTGSSIQVRSTLPHTRKRWEIARQIGMFLMDRHGVEPVKRDADKFAAELLLPPKTVESHYRKRREWLKNALAIGMSATKDDMVRGLAWQFEVDYRAMAIRLDELHLGPGAGPNKRIWSVSPGSLPPPEDNPP
jgi:hypothetical protein